MGNKPICLPLTSEAQYREYVDNPARYRQSLTQRLSQHPALFPKGMDQGFTLHDSDAAVKQDLTVRRMQLQATGAVFTLRPSCVMPSRIAGYPLKAGHHMPQWFQALKALASSDGHSGHF